MGKKKLRPFVAIGKFCLECVHGCSNDVRACPLSDCPLWGVRSAGLNRAMASELPGAKPMASKPKRGGRCG